ncbi:MAG: hypothetical protein MUF54_05120 [Polyangiaceae bacterium]|jgi:hypothetical protein|nr:hypothetical protein [Polyangiaceae bacterium]
MRTIQFGVFGVVVTLAPASLAQPSGPPSASGAVEQGSAPTDAALMAELQGAASRDAAALQASRADAGIRAEQRAEDPAGLVLGQQVVGNESNPSISLIVDVAFAYFRKTDRMRWGGHAPQRAGPNIQGAELAISAPVDPFFKVDLAYALGHAHIEEVYLTTTSLPWNLQLRAGQFKSQVGRHNPTHLHSWDFALHPMPNQFLFGGEGLTLPGVEASVLMPLPWYVEVIGALQAGEAGSFRTKSSEQGDPEMKDFVVPTRLVQFLDVGDDWGLQIGLDGVFGTSVVGPEVGNRTEAYGADMMVKWRPIGDRSTGYTYVKWTTEAWLRRMQVPDDAWRDVGGYSDLVFGLGKEWNAGARAELWKRTSGDDPTEQNGRAQFGFDMVRGSGVVSYLPSHFSRVRLQYSYEHSELYEDNHIGLLQLEVSAGAHGAHQY